MRRRETPPDPEVLRALEELDAALAREPGADPDLLRFAHDVRTTREEPTPAFLSRLDERAAASFGAPAIAARPRRWLRVAPPALAAAACLAVAVIVVGSGGTTGDERASSGDAVEAVAPQGEDAAGGAGAGSAAPQSKDAAGGAGAGSAAPQSTAAAPAPAARDDAGARRVERSAELTLTAAPGDVQEVADGVVRATQSVGGYVARSQVSTTDGGGGATFTLSIPTDRLDDALARLSKLAHVGALTQAGTDITGSFVSAVDRLADARAERRALLRALGRADTAGEIAALRARLAQNRSDIAARKGELDSVRRRAARATVAVAVEGTGAAAVPGDEGGGWSTGDALHDAGRVLEVLTGALLVGLAVLVPAALLALAGWLGAGGMRRRRRERALRGAV